MVRLKDIQVVEDWKSVQFQFHNGPIKSVYYFHNQTYIPMFQFHNGPIKSMTCTIAEYAPISFNSTMVRLKVMANWIELFKLFVSIPQWSD